MTIKSTTEQREFMCRILREWIEGGREHYRVKAQELIDFMLDANKLEARRDALANELSRRYVCGSLSGLPCAEARRLQNADETDARIAMCAECWKQGDAEAPEREQDKEGAA